MLALNWLFSMGSGAILLQKMKWTGSVEKRLHSLFWISVLGTFFVSFLGGFLGAANGAQYGAQVVEAIMPTAKLILYPLRFLAILLIAFRIDYRNLSTFYKFIAIILYASIFFLIVTSIFSYLG